MENNKQSRIKQEYDVRIDAEASDGLREAYEVYDDLSEKDQEKLKASDILLRIDAMFYAMPEKQRAWMKDGLAVLGKSYFDNFLAQNKS